MTLIVLTGASGSGKTLMVKSIEHHKHWMECISHTTRKMRVGEANGKTYTFISHAKFDEMVEDGEFAEHVTYDNNYYGITHKEIKRVMSNGKVAVLIAEYQGYKQIKKLYPEAVGIFIYMKKEECMANMLLRGNNIDEAMRRISTYDEEMEKSTEFDYVVRNVRDKKQETMNVLISIVKQYYINDSLSIYNLLR